MSGGSVSLAKKRPISAESAAAVDDAATAALADLQQRLGYKFADTGLLELALTHRSRAYETRHGVQPVAEFPWEENKQRNEPGTDNEQLEFVGDAVLGLAVTEAMFREFPRCTEGVLTRLRAALVGRKRLAEMGIELGLGEFLRLGKSAEQNGGRKKPALLANTAEAVIAAVYLDSLAVHGDGLTPVRAIAEKFLVQPELAALRAAVEGDASHGAMRDHKTLLQERVQANAAGRLRYHDTGQTGPPHQRSFSVEAVLENDDGAKVLAAAEGASKKEAQQRAAELALEAWKPEPAKPARKAKSKESAA
jgi:ribonuclease-3